MKLTLRKRVAKHAGSALIVTLVMCSVLALSIFGYLSLVEQQSKLSARSQAWNVAIALVEAGLEEGLQHLNSNNSNLASQGWSGVGTQYQVTRSLQAGSYTVVINNSTPLTPEITCQSAVNSASFASFATIGANAQSTISRRVRVKCWKGSLFIKALAAKHKVNLNGNNVITDSFDSSDPLWSTGGLYDPAKVKDSGDVASNDSVVNAISVGNANIYGHVSTGPGGSVDVNNGGVGSHVWQASNKGFQEGWVTHDSNFTFPDTTIPYTTGLAPTSGKVLEQVTTMVNGVPVTTTVETHYDNILQTGKYYISGPLTGKTIVLGKAQLVCAGGISMNGNDVLKIAPGASLTNWVGGTTVSLGGNGVVNKTGNAANYVCFCAPSVTTVSMGGNGEFTGVMVAPEADTQLNGGGSGWNDYIGCLMIKSIRLNGHFKFHYDEALGKMAGNGRFLIKSWDEIAVL